jgi:ABC-type polysaccharide/polyol phosphate export permease
MMVESSFQAAWADLRDGFKQISLAGMLGWQDVVRRYRRSRIGAFWLSINIVIMIGAIGTIFTAPSSRLGSLDFYIKHDHGIIIMLHLF